MAGKPGVINTGKMRHRFEVQSIAGTTRNAAGEVLEDWQTQGVRWGSIDALSGRDLMQAMQINALITHQIAIWHYAGLEPLKWRLVKDRNRVFNIVFARDPEELHAVHELLCVEVLR